MAIYTSITQEGSLSQQQRKEIAEAVTKIHVDATGAPRSFVNVRFFTYPADIILEAARNARPPILLAIYELVGI
jgi:phenylpyruvate tautomerase PptA (4-oxalocrotonate tautomerase family)